MKKRLKMEMEKLLHRYTFLDMDLEATCSDDNKIFGLGTLDLKD